MGACQYLKKEFGLLCRLPGIGQCTDDGVYEECQQVLRVKCNKCGKITTMLCLGKSADGWCDGSLIPMETYGRA